jgi:chemotaxis family two-component system response regulator Rcp1
MDTVPIQILMIEDNEGDVLLTMRAFKTAKVSNNLNVVRDGVEAMDFLHRRGDFASAPRPDLVLLDLNLPRRDGRQVLADMKADPLLRSIPVVILTSSKAEDDVARMYDLHANCYIVKPVDFHRLIEIVQAIEGFWLSIVRLPPQNK